MRVRPPILRDSLLIVLAYMAARAGIYALLPAHTNAAWSHRDAVMCAPRLAAFAALWACNRFRWKNAVPFDFRAAGKGFLLPALLLIFAECLRTYMFADHSWPPGQALGGIAATVPVVLFEEYAFRGGILHGLSTRFGTTIPLLLGSALFVLFHIQAQPLDGWPAIFLFGLAWGGLRLRGLGLGWLALIHFIVDSLYFAGVDYPPFGSEANLAYLLTLLIAALFAWPREKMRN